MYNKEMDDTLSDFKRIDGFSDYFINTNGMIINCKRETLRVMNPKITQMGYYSVGLRDSSGERTFHFNHRLVAKTFIPNPKGNHRHVNHIDGNKLNNHVSNLEWCTPSMNTQHASDNGLMPMTLKPCRLFLEGLFISSFDKKQDLVNYVADITGYSFDSVRKHFTGYRPIDNFPQYDVIENKRTPIVGIKNNSGGWTAQLNYDGVRYEQFTGKCFDEAVRQRIMFESLYLKEKSQKYNSDTNTLQFQFESLDDGLPTFIESNLQGNILTHTKLPPTNPK